MLALLSLLIVLTLLVLFPFFFAELMFASLSKLHLDPSMALALVIAIFVGGLLNIPVKSIEHDRDVVVHPLAVYGFADFWPQLKRVHRRTIIAVNVGGCLIPTGLVFYEIMHLLMASPKVLAVALLGCSFNIVACYIIARPVAGIGIVMPGVVSPLVAVSFAKLLAPDLAAPVAFIIGVVGPLVGADLMHLKDVETSELGIASIGGAGTFDGIILSGIVAAYLA
ncbi:MAG TPA: DUF1614 domain-containing protein [Xanthobacteraceae bacterium]|nr:DUF1614 domain-containing protein [Xanthobacteraceae bacterium]